VSATGGRHDKTGGSDVQDDDQESDSGGGNGLPALPWKRPTSTRGRCGAAWGDSELEPILANAAHIGNVRGRNTDANDAAWLTHLTAPGLTAGELRDRAVKSRHLAGVITASSLAAMAAHSHQEYKSTFPG